MSCRVLVVVAALWWAGCAPKTDLPDTPVRADTAAELTGFRAELAARFPGPRLQDFDTALQELKLDAMARDVASAEGREQDMRAKVSGQTVRAAEILGWQARAARLRREMALITDLLARDRKRLQETKSSDAALAAATHVQNEEEILARLEAQLAETTQRLEAWGKPAGENQP